VNWIPALSTSTALAVILWLSRNLIITRLTNSVRHEYDEKIERLKADLKAKDSKIDALRNGVLSGISNRQTIIFNKQIDATEKLWSAVLELSPAKAIASTIANTPFDIIEESAKSDSRIRELFSDIHNVELKDILTPQALQVRPFLSPLTWAYFSAYQAILVNSVLKIKMFQIDVSIEKFKDTEHIIKLIEVVLPNRVEYIKKHGANASFFLLEELENNILKTFEMLFEGKLLDDESLKRAADIIKESELLMAESNKTE